jgi:formylglycine-generating enzyme required for sulfatase activity
MQATTPEAPSLETGRECPRCSVAMRPDWNFCPACSLPARPSEEILSSQIRTVRELAAAESHRPAPAVLRWTVAAAGAALLLGTVGVGVLLWEPGASRYLFEGEPPPAPPPPAGSAFAWALIPGGPFRYGPPAAGLAWTEEVDVPEFWISLHEITNRQWGEFLEAHRDELLALGEFRSSVPPSWTWRADDAAAPRLRELPEHPALAAELPVRGISYEAALRYCGWLHATRRVPGARIPREDEWEKAARGVDGRTYPWGEAFTARSYSSGRETTVDAAVVSGVTPVPVSYSPTDVSPYGCLHMGGNVSEWTDLWGRRPGEGTGPWDRDRVIRGASFQSREDGAIYARTWTADVRMQRELGAPDVGFRIATSEAPADGGGR